MILIIQTTIPEALHLTIIYNSHTIYNNSKTIYNYNVIENNNTLMQCIYNTLPPLMHNIRSFSLLKTN